MVRSLTGRGAYQIKRTNQEQNHFTGIAGVDLPNHLHRKSEAGRSNARRRQAE
jgi:hypothetical protein